MSDVSYIHSFVTCTKEKNCVRLAGKIDLGQTDHGSDSASFAFNQ